MDVQYKDPASPRRPVQVPLSQLFQDANFLNVGYRSATGEILDDFPMDMVSWTTYDFAW